MGLLRLMGNKADVVKGLAKRCNEKWKVAPTSDIVRCNLSLLRLLLTLVAQGLYLSDIQDHLITMTQNLNHYEKILSRSHSNYLAQISIEMTDANNQINDVLSKLTALGTILVPMNLITGMHSSRVLPLEQPVYDGHRSVGHERARSRAGRAGLCVVWLDHRRPGRDRDDWWVHYLQAYGPVRAPRLPNVRCVLWRPRFAWIFLLCTSRIHSFLVIEFTIHICLST
jgi:hypothetical protein